MHKKKLPVHTNVKTSPSYIQKLCCLHNPKMNWQSWLSEQFTKLNLLTHPMIMFYFSFLKIQQCYTDWSNSQAFLQPLFCIGHNLSSPSFGSVFSSAPQALKQSQSLGSQWDNSFATVHGPPSPPFPSHVHLCTGVYIRKMRDNSSQKCFLKTSLFHVPALLFSLLHPFFPDTFSLALITRLDTCCQRRSLSTLTVLLNRHCPSNRSLQWKKPKSPAVTQDP